LSEWPLPLTLAVGGLIPPGTLGAVEAALAGLPKPPDGFAVFDGRPLKLTGRILNRSELANLTVNGVDVLKLLSPTGSFALQLPATTKTVSAAVTDTRGASATAYYPVAHVTPRRQGSSVKAAEAVGLSIARIRYLMRGVLTTHRLRMTVTVKDRAGRVVQGAAVAVRVRKRGLTSTRMQAKRTARTGSATFAIKVRRRGLGKRLFIVTTAKTPSASATRTTSVRVPAARHVRDARRR
jgi:hypothetical protein